MGIITISRGSYSKGKEIAEKLAEKTGYECVSRDILLEASEHFNIPEIKLIRAIHDAPSILDRFKHGREKYITFVREAFLEHIRKDNVIYHGLAGHFFAQGISNVLKVRIIANIEDRVREEMKREAISEDEARYILRKDDEERRKWSLHLYGIDTGDPSLYDVVLHVDNLKVNDAVEILFNIAGRPCFQTTPKAQARLGDMLLEAKAQAALIDRLPTAQVKVKSGVAYVNYETALALEEETVAQVREILGRVEGIGDVRVNIVPYDIAE